MQDLSTYGMTRQTVKNNLSKFYFPSRVKTIFSTTVFHCCHQFVSYIKKLEGKKVLNKLMVGQQHYLTAQRFASTS